MKWLVSLILAMVLAGFIGAFEAHAAEPVHKYAQVAVLHVVDGDTVDLSVQVGFGITYQGRFRLARIDTPEKGQPGYLEATVELRRLLALLPLTLTVTGRDKYGRWLAELYTGTANINDALLKGGFAKLY